MKKSLNFYNQFDKKLINDYVLGNKRIVSAIEKLSQFIPENSDKILDIGCGLGWSSYEFAKTYSSSLVTAIDLSPVLIETATKLFGAQENLTFRAYDLTQGLPVDTYNAIIMIDVYEHIPLTDRFLFHSSLKNIIAKNGRLILACPSKYHQEYLKKNNPSGLQPIDEDVDYETVKQIADEISGEVIFFEYQNIWNNYDYLYAVIEINPTYEKKSNDAKNVILKLESKKEREHRVQTKLGIKINKEKRQKKASGIKKVLKRIKK